MKKETTSNIVFIVTCLLFLPVIIVGFICLMGKVMFAYGAELAKLVGKAV